MLQRPPIGPRSDTLTVHSMARNTLCSDWSTTHTYSAARRFPATAATPKVRRAVFAQPLSDCAARRAAHRWKRGNKAIPTVCSASLCAAEK